MGAKVGAGGVTSRAEARGGGTEPRGGGTETRGGRARGVAAGAGRVAGGGRARSLGAGLDLGKDGAWELALEGLVVVGMLLVLTENSAVKSLGTTGSGKEEPDDEEGLQDIPHGDPVEDGTSGNSLEEVEGAKDDLETRQRLSDKTLLTQ